MADEQLTTEEVAQEGVVAPPEEQQGEQTQAAPRTVEDFARERGWNPDYQGEDRRTAEEFISFGMDRNRDLMSKVGRLEETTDRMARTQAQIMEQAVEKARSEERARWESRHREAVENGDLQTAQQAVQKIADLTHQPVQHQPDPLVTRFVSENAWFNTDPDARALAQAVSERAAAAGASVQEQLDQARAAVHKRFAEYAPQTTKAAPTVAQPSARVADTRSRKKGFNDMPAAAQEACRALVAKGYATTDGYVANYFNQGAA